MIASVLWTASMLLRAIYLLLPVASIALGWHAATPLRRFLVGGWISGSALGAGLLVVYSVAIGGHLPPGQVALTVYLGVSLMLFLKTADFCLLIGLRKAILNADPSRWRLFGVALTRVVLFSGFALPWVMAAAMVYRPRVAPDGPPLGVKETADAVDFSAADGTHIHGWYLPGSDRSTSTALLCHGLGGDPAGFARLIERLHGEGFGVLAIDLRAHGESGGQLCTFGRRERDDVLGAVAWLKSEHSDTAERIIGIGASLGAAALLSAAADEVRIDGVVVLSTYATLPAEVEDISRRQLVFPIGWLVRHFGLPIASLHCGVDLNTVRPVDDIAKLWPRPVLVVHGMGDEIIPFEQGRQLFDAAPIGRSYLWVRGGSHNGVLDDATAIDRVLNFIRLAKPLPLV